MNRCFVLLLVVMASFSALAKREKVKPVPQHQNFVLSDDELNARIERHLREARDKAPEYISEKMLPDWAMEPLENVSVLMKYVDVEDENGINVYYPKGVYFDEKENSVHFYFEANGRVPINPCLAFFYYADDSLDIQSVDFIINDEKFSYEPQEVIKGSEGKMIWEWFDDKLDSDCDWLITLFAHANNASMRIHGASCNHIRDLNAEQIKELRHLAQLYLQLKN